MSRVSVSRSLARHAWELCVLEELAAAGGKSCFMQDSLVIAGAKAEVQLMLLFSFYCSWLC